MPEPHPVVAALRRRRKERRLTQHEMARICDTSQSHISEVESGLTSPTVAILDRWAGSLGLSLSLTYREVPDAE